MLKVKSLVPPVFAWVSVALFPALVGAVHLSMLAVFLVLVFSP